MSENRFHMADYQELAYVKKVLNNYRHNRVKVENANKFLDEIMSKQDNSPEMKIHENKTCVECGSRYLDYCRCGGGSCGPGKCHNCGMGAEWEVLE